MTTATYTTNLGNIYTGAGSTTGWTALGGGAAGLNAETDFYIEGTGCTSKNAFASATKGMIYNHGSDAGGSGTDGAYIGWITHLTPNSLDTIAGGGLQFLIGSGTGDYVHYYVGGSDTIEFGGWVLAAVNEATAGDQADTGSPSATVEQYFGALYDLPTGGPTKGAPNAIDGIRFGRCDIIVEHGTGADPEAGFDGIITNLETATNRYGLLVSNQGAFYNSGLLQLGSSTNAVEFTDSNKTIFLRDHPHVTTNFHTWEVQNASSIISLTNLVVKALGIVSKGRWVTTDNATVSKVGCTFIDMGTFGYNTGAVLDTCTYLSCEQITHGGADMSGSSVFLSAVAADDGAVLYNEIADPDGEMDNMTFSKGTNAHHAIRFGTSVTTDITLRGIDFTGFGSTDDANDAIFRFDATSGSLNLNLVGCTTDGTFSVDDAAGITVTVVIDPVTTLVHVDDNTGADLQNARVLLEASDATGDFPYQDSVTITHVTTTASVSHTAHGLVANDRIVIRSADQGAYNGVFVITNVTTNAYDYTMGSDPGTNATGTITATGAILGDSATGLTDVSGDTSASRTFILNTPVKGFVRKSTTSPRFKSFPISGTISNSTGLTINVRMILDE